MKFLVVLVVSLLGSGHSITSTTSTEPPAARYDDFKVYRVYVKDAQQLIDFKKLSNELPVVYLTDVGSTGRYDVVIDPANQQRLESQLQFYELEFECVIEDLQQTLEASTYVRSSNPVPMEWTQYHGLFDIYYWLDNLAVEYKRYITSYTIGYSYEGRPIKAVKISTKLGNKAIFIESNIHAMEWISSATTTCFVDSLLKANNTEMKTLLTNYDWIFVPVLNPDGFEYSHNVQRVWRKNRKPTGFSNSSGICYGTDMNRNFDYHWGGSGWNLDVPCDHWYAGAKANTEPEIVALQTFVNSTLKLKKDYIRMYLAFHSYGNYVLLPYGHTNEVFPPNYDQMIRIASAFVLGARVRYGTRFLTGASGLLNYPVSGAAKDWAYGVKNIPFTATIELRDVGQYGFFLPASQIVEVCAEVTDGLVAMVKKATAEGLFK